MDRTIIITRFANRAYHAAQTIAQNVAEHGTSMPIKLAFQPPLPGIGRDFTRREQMKKPRDDAWKRVTLGHLASLGQRMWLRCNVCGHEQIVEPLAFAAFHDLSEHTALLNIAERLKCTACGAHQAHAWPEPYNSLAPKTD